MNRAIDDLNSKKDLIIDSIIAAISPYSDFDEQELTSFVSKTINKARIFFKDDDMLYLDIPSKKRYQKQLNNLSSTLSQISKINHTVSLDFTNPITFELNVPSKKRIYNNNHITYDIYQTYKQTFEHLQIPLHLLEVVYQNSNEELFTQYVRTLFKISTKISDYKFSVGLQAYKLEATKNWPIEEIDSLISSYNLRDVFSLQDFYNKLVFLLETPSSQTQTKQYKQTLNYVLNKINLTSPNYKLLKRHRRFIESRFSNIAIRTLFTNNQLKEETSNTIKQCKLEDLSTKDYSTTLRLIITLNFDSSLGVCDFVKDTSLIGLKSSLFSYDNKTQIGIITHEYIHCLEIINKEGFKYFRKQYRAINEMLTEYLSRMATNIFYPNVLFSNHDESKKTIYGYKFYDYKMKPLFKTYLFDLLLKAKINGNISELESFVGKPTLIKICNALNHEDAESGRSLMQKAVIDFNKKHLSKL